MTKHPVRRDVHCCKRQAWAYDSGICVQPINHATRCKFVWSERVEVDDRPKSGLFDPRLDGLATLGF